MKFAILFLTLMSLSCSTAADVITDIEKDLEQKRLLRLGKTMQGQQIQPFSTDGCSGGLSAGWEFFAGKFPKFAARFGATPPWEYCCVAHDKDYWRGETKNGYELRKQADNALKSCVEQSHSVMNNQAKNGPPEEVSLNLKITAQLMYRAVRLGGKPCTVFPWRWGYGWPECTK